MSSCLYIVSTPIGHKEDITLRALRILNEVDYIAAEDTRHSKPLLQHYQITTPLISLHAFNEHTRTQVLIDHLIHGKNVALISDAGTPLICDPGYLLVQAARAHGIQVCPIPGACALIAALSASGLSTDAFQFIGFLPSKSQARKKKLSTLLHASQTTIFYESTHRILDCLTDMLCVLGDAREIVLAKEITKSFETFFKGTLPEAHAFLTADAQRIKGEFVVLIRGVESTSESVEITPAFLLDTLIKQGISTKQAVELATLLTGIRKNRLKDLLQPKSQSVRAIAPKY